VRASKREEKGRRENTERQRKEKKVRENKFKKIDALMCINVLFSFNFLFC